MRRLTLQSIGHDNNPSLRSSATATPAPGCTLVATQIALLAPYEAYVPPGSWCGADNAWKQPDVDLCYADKVAVMKHGRIVEHGTYQELSARGVDFYAEVEEGGGSQLKAPDDDTDDGPGASEREETSLALANGTNGEHKASTAAKPQLAGSLQADGQGTAAAKNTAPQAAALAKGDFIKVLRLVGVLALI